MEDATIALWSWASLVPKYIFNKIRDELPDNCEPFLLDIVKDFSTIKKEAERGNQYDFAVFLITPNMVRHENFSVVANHLAKSYGILGRLYPVGIDGVEVQHYSQIAPDLAKIKLLKVNSQNDQDVSNCQKIIRSTIEKYMIKPAPKGVSPLSMLHDFVREVQNYAPQPHAKPPPLPALPSPDCPIEERLPKIAAFYRELFSDRPDLPSSAIPVIHHPLKSEDIPVEAKKEVSKANEESKEPETESKFMVDLTCPICMEAQINTLFIPCCHLGCCYECALKMKNNTIRNCPFCSEMYKRFIKVYYPV